MQRHAFEHEHANSNMFHFKEFEKQINPPYLVRDRATEVYS